MSTLTIKLPDPLLKTIRCLAKAEGMSVNQFVSSAAGEKLAASKGSVPHIRIFDGESIKVADSVQCFVTFFEFEASQRVVFL